LQATESQAPVIGPISNWWWLFMLKCDDYRINSR
jgi:hypothetical protein